MYQVEEIIALANSTQAKINGKWVPARPIRFGGFWYSLRDAWLVFRGKADAVIWPEGQ
jgi:hypothetical protein